MFVLSATMRNELMTRLRVRGMQARVARDLGLSATTVNKWAMGYNLPEPERLPALEAALDMEPGSLGALAMPPGAGDLIGELRNEIRSLGVEVAQLRSELQQLRDERTPPRIAAAAPRQAARSTS